MNRYANRLVIALVISSSCYYGTIYWYNSQVSDGYKVKSNKAIAVLSTQLNEVQRKPISRVIWEELSKGDQLYTGETIRTTDDSEAKIIFLTSGTTIELESDSQVILEETPDGISLDFLKGNLFVKSDKGSAGGLTIKSGKNTIDLANAELGLSKTKKGDVNLQVVSGVAKLLQNGKQVNIDKTKSGTLNEKGEIKSSPTVKVLSPVLGQALYIDPRKKEPQTFNWEKLPEGYTVYFEAGRKRNKLKRFKRIAVDGRTGKMQVKMRKVGKFYWRLVAEANNPVLDDRKSTTMRSELFAKISPSPISPKANETVVLDAGVDELRLKWAAKTNYQNFYLEVATDKRLKNKIAKQTVDKMLNFANVNFSRSGTYYWRISGYMDINGKSTGISSPIQKFTLQKGVVLSPPSLQLPLAEERIPYKRMLDSGLFLNWDPIPGIKKYKVYFTNLTQAKKVGKRTVQKKEVIASMIKLKTLQPGKYEWTVTSINTESGEESKKAKKRRFYIEELSKVEWANGPGPSNFYYVTKKPFLSAKWKEAGEGSSVSSWRYRFAPKGQLKSDVLWVNSNSNSVKAWVNQPAAYDIQVEALNSKGKAVARSSVKTITVSEKPLLPAPEFGVDFPSPLKANKSGNVNVAWEQVDGAKQYKIFLKDRDGNVVKETTSRSTKTALTRLKPGNYKVSVRAIDKHKRIGNESQLKNVKVPKSSNIKAPVFKSLKVN